MDESEELRPNKVVVEKLKSREVEIIGFSSHRNDLKKFSGEAYLWDFGTPKTTEELFSFLLENTMNRYLFNLMVRKSPNIDLWPINDEDLTEKNLKYYTFGQSFVRLYKCYDCKYRLKRLYSPQLSTIPKETILECPNCGLEKLVSPADYEYSFQLIRKDLKKFSEKLEEIGILQSKKFVLCSECDLELGIENDNFFQKNCPRCGCDKQKYVERKEFSDNFLSLCHSNFGLWFEWFIYEIAKRIFDSVDNGLILSYKDEEGNNQEKEVDIVALSSDNKLILIECKDYIGHTPPDQYRTIIKVADLFDEVYVVNFYKPHKDVKKTIVSKSNIKLLNGNDIDGVLLNNELIISRLSAKKVWFGGNPITSISKDKKLSLLKEITSDYEDRKNIIALIKILENKLINPLFWHSHCGTKSKEIFNKQLDRISNIGKTKENITDCLRLIVAYYQFFNKDELLDIANPVQILDIIKGKINLMTSSEQGLIRRIYKIIFDYYNKGDFDLSGINENEFFNQIFDDLHSLYFLFYDWNIRCATLDSIYFIFEKITTNKVQKFVDLIEKEFKNPQFHTGSVADKLFKIFSKYSNRFDEKGIAKVQESAKFLHTKGINDYVINSAWQFLDFISKYNEEET